MSTEEQHIIIAAGDHRAQNTLRVPVIELFGPTIQGEGLMTGTVTHFLRTGGCSYRCSWCDSMHAVDPKQVKANKKMMEVNEIIQAIHNMPYAPYVTLTGGDPAIWSPLGVLTRKLNLMGLKVAIETQGVVFPDWLHEVDVLTFSPKPPSSGNPTPLEPLMSWLDAYAIQERTFQVCIKVVVGSADDMAYAMHVYESLRSQWYDSFYFTAVSPVMEEDHNPDTCHATEAYKRGVVIATYKSLAEVVMNSNLELNEKVHVGCQQHVLLWPNKNTGV